MKGHKLDNKEPEKNNKETGIVESYAKKQVESLMAKMQKKNKQENKKTKFYYSFLTIVLLFFLIQVGFGVILNISKIISYRTKILVLEKIKNHAEANNIDLKQNITRFSSSSSLEGIARNNLKMAGEDEVLILINDPKEQQKLEEEQKKIQELKNKKNKKLMNKKRKNIENTNSQINTQSENTEKNENNTGVE